MRILFISDLLNKENIGANTLTKAHLKTLQEMFGYDSVDVLSIGKAREKKTDYYELTSYKTNVGKIINMLQGYHYNISNNVLKFIYKIINEKKHDVVFIDESLYGIVVKKIKKYYPNVKVIVFYHDVKKSLSKEWVKEYGIKYFPVHIVTLINEKLSEKYADINLTLNSRESRLLFESYGNKPQGELPIYINDDKDILNKVNFSKTDYTKPIKILFVGAYYYPNVHGIMWFIENVIDKIDASLDVVGRDIERIRESVDNEKVNIIGSVDDLSKYYLNADIIVAPIFKGAGMKVKTAEAFKYGKIVFATDEALEGYDVEFGEYCEVCNTSEEFIYNINRYIEEKKITKFNEKSRKLYEDKYSLEASKKIISELLNKKN